jgi:hypothetical protein
MENEFNAQPVNDSPVVNESGYVAPDQTVYHEDKPAPPAIKTGDRVRVTDEGVQDSTIYTVRAVEPDGSLIHVKENHPGYAPKDVQLVTDPEIKPFLADVEVAKVKAVQLGSVTVIAIVGKDELYRYIKVRHGAVEYGGTHEWGTGSEVELAPADVPELVKRKATN